MNENSPGTITKQTGSKADRSIVFKLNSKMVLRLIGIFFSLDIFLLAAAAAAVVVRAEKTSAEIAEHLASVPAYQEEQNPWLEISGQKVLFTESSPQGLEVPDQFSFLLPEETAGAVRSIHFTINEQKRLEGMTYIVGLQSAEGAVLIETDLTFSFRMIRIFCVILLALELIEILKSASSGSRLIRRTLRPLNELASVTETLNAARGTLSMKEMQTLASKLDNINASRLDTRISVDGTQQELKKLASAINGLLDRINEAYRSQVRFVSDASHELRTPISVIQGYANLLDRWGKNDPKALQESIDAIKDETANMKELVEKLLFLARGDNNTLALQLEQVQLDALADEVIRESKMLDASHSFEARLEPAAIVADEALLKQALRVLVDNAIKYTPSGGNIVLSVGIDQGLARLTVQDDGIGIPPEALPKVFDRFYRADESRARATGGNGLGLSITKWIVERHGGHMEVLSRTDLGTRISMVLPVGERTELKE